MIAPTRGSVDSPNLAACPMGDVGAVFDRPRATAGRPYERDEGFFIFRNVFREGVFGGVPAAGRDLVK